ncbi:DUF2786 domain-containing protein [Streptomyces variabilis]
MSIDDKTLARVRSILAKAEDPAASPEEAEAYFAKAAELMAKYGIERAMLADAKPETDRPADRKITVDGTYVLDRVALLAAITSALGGQSVRWRTYDVETRKYVQVMHLYGYESTLDRVELLYTSLLLQAFNGMKYGRPQPGESTTAYRKTWLAGFRNAIYNRLLQAEHRAAEEARPETGGRSAALVLADRAAVIKRRFQADHPHVRMAPKRSLSGSGWGAGKAAGERADLGGTRVGSGRRRALFA